MESTGTSSYSASREASPALSTSATGGADAVSQTQPSAGPDGKDTKRKKVQRDQLEQEIYDILDEIMSLLGAVGAQKQTEEAPKMKP